MDKGYRQGVAQLATLGLSYDAWLFFHQLPELFEFAKAVPDTPVVINHCGGIVRIGAYEGHRSQVFETWLHGMRQLAKLPNVYVKLGGLGMRINGFEFEKGATPPTSHQLVEASAPMDGAVHRAVRGRPLHVRKQFPCRQGFLQLCHVLERLQTTDLQRGCR